jgi:hypothetical protein
MRNMVSQSRKAGEYSGFLFFFSEEKKNDQIEENTLERPNQSIDEFQSSRGNYKAQHQTTLHNYERLKKKIKFY